jgi:hypothetical protein
MLNDEDDIQAIAAAIASGEIVLATDPGAVSIGGDVSASQIVTGNSNITGDRLRIYPQNQDFARDLTLLQKKLPAGDLFFSSATNDEQLRLVRVESDVDPGSTYLFNRETGNIEKLYESRPDLPSESLAPMRPVRYTASALGHKTITDNGTSWKVAITSASVEPIMMS